MGDVLRLTQTENFIIFKDLVCSQNRGVVMRPMSEEEFVRRYADTHAELEAQAQLSKLTHKDQPRFPEDLNARNVKKLKRPIEARCMRKRKEQLQDYILDGISVRAKDILDRKQVPMKDLLKVAVSAMPREVKMDATVTTNTVMDLWNDIEEAQDADIVE